MLRRLCAMLVLAGCANAGDPPGGPADLTPPTVIAIDPDSGALLAAPPHEATIRFDKVISERVVGQSQDIRSAVILSPDVGVTRVGWHRDYLTVRPHDGFKPDRVYRIELLPVISDLRNNRLRLGRVIVFSTGPPIPAGRIEGSIVDWVGGKPAPRALVEAVLMPDSLVYRSLADSGGFFTVAPLPAGRYVVYGVLDANGDRRRGPREAFDSAAVTLDSTAALDLFAFTHDTVAPRLRQVENIDSMGLRLTFDRPLDPSVALDPTNVRVAPATDSTASLPLAGVYTQKQLDSVLAGERAAKDSAAAASRRAAADSATAAALARGDTAAARRAAQQAPAPAAPAPVPSLVRGPARGIPPRPPLDSTRAEKMLARRPAPSDVRIVRLQSPLQVDARYIVYVTGATSLTGRVGPARSQIRIPRPPRPPAARDTTTRDSTRARRDTASVRPVRP